MTINILKGKSKEGGKAGKSTDCRERERETPAEKVLTDIEIKIRTSKNCYEIELLRSILLAAGITCLSNQNSKDITLAIKEKDNNKDN